MKYLSVSQIAKQWDISERSVRHYCSQGRVSGAFLTGKTWNIPENAIKPHRKNGKSDLPQTLLERLKFEKAHGVKGGIYQKIQIELTYHSNHMEGNRLSHEQTRLMYETNAIGIGSQAVNVDDIVETANHFRAIDMIIDNVNAPLTENFIKTLHSILKNGTSDSRKPWFAVGDYKTIPNEVGGRETCPPQEVAARMKALLAAYKKTKDKTLEEIVAFHYEFESIHPFQDGNGRVGRLILFKECLNNNIVPFIIDDNLKMFYYHGLSEWKQERGFLVDTCLSAQDKMKAWLDYFQIPYEK